MKQKFITIKELSDYNKWLEVLAYSETLYIFMDQYKETYQRAVKLVKPPIDWGQVAEAAEAGHKDELQGSEMYLRIAGDYFKTQFKEGSELWEKTISKEQDPKDKEGIDYSQFLINCSNLYKYEIYLIYLLTKTKSYQEITKVKLSDFNLPEIINFGIRNKPETKENMIQRAIAYKYRLGEMELGRPPLRDIANLIKAPYSIILQAYKQIKF